MEKLLNHISWSWKAQITDVHLIDFLCQYNSANQVAHFYFSQFEYKFC